MTWLCETCKCNKGLHPHRYKDDGGFDWTLMYVNCQEQADGTVWTKLAVPCDWRCPSYRRKK